MMPDCVETATIRRRGWLNGKWAMVQQLSQSSLQKFRTKSLATRRHWGKFCMSTSIHGMRYLAEPSRSWMERLWWVVVVFFGFLAATYYVSRQFVKWSQTAIEADNYNIHEDMMKIPFPAFTFCDNRKIAIPKNETFDPFQQNLLYMMCGDDRITSSNYTIEDFFEWSPPLIVECLLVVDDKKKLNPTISHCESMVVRTLTNQGICYTVNMFDPDQIFKDHLITNHGHHGRASEWNLDTGYLPKSPMIDENDTESLKGGSFPKRAKHTFLLSIYHDNETKPGFCAGKSDGFKITVHSPHEMPMVGYRESPWIPIQDDGDSEDKFIEIPAHGKVLVDLRARKIVASSNLHIYSSEQRRCFFPGERKLAYFRVYSFNNCHLECLTNHTLEICGCKDFYMPTWEDDESNTSNICTGSYSIRCIHHAYDFWDKNRLECRCLPTCTTLQYNTKTWYNNRPMINDREDEGYNKTVIWLYSTDPFYVKSERRAVYSLVDFIADCGGVFGLFCGMSIISLLEFIYYSMLWFINNKKMNLLLK